MRLGDTTSVLISFMALLGLNYHELKEIASFTIVLITLFVQFYRLYIIHQRKNKNDKI